MVVWSVGRKADKSIPAPLDQEYMVKLFDLGYRMALSGYPWGKTPPGF
jgi:hypothetical protein